MLLYTIRIEGEFITFSGIIETPTTGTKRSHRKQFIKEIRTSDAAGFLVLVYTDDNTVSYDYTKVADPDTGLAFTSLETFRVYILNNLMVHF